jgi:hypothetical protein
MVGLVALQLVLPAERALVIRRVTIDIRLIPSPDLPRQTRAKRPLSRWGKLEV